MPSSLLELNQQLDVACEASQQATASGSIGARTIVLTFPGFPSCCTEILINFEDIDGSGSKRTPSEEANVRSPPYDLSNKSNDEPGKSQPPKTCEDAHEFDQSTVYIGLDSGLTAGRKKTRKKTDSLVRTLPVLARCSRRWLNFRSRKGHQRERICAFESGDVGKITDSSTSVENRNHSPGQKFDTKQRFVSPRTSLTLLNCKPTSGSHDRKKSLERSHETKGVKYSSRKSKSGVGISETKQELVHGEETETTNTKQKSNHSMDQLNVDQLSQQQVVSCKRIPQVEFDISGSHEKVKKYGAGRYSETRNDRCKVREASDRDRLSEDGLQFSAQPPSHLAGRMANPPASSNVVSRTTGHKVLDTMFVDVIKMMLEQEDPHNAKKSSTLHEREENHNFQAALDDSNTGQQVKEHSAFGNNTRSSDKDGIFEIRKPQELLEGSLSKNVLPPGDVSELNFPLKTNSCDRNISCDGVYGLQSQASRSNSNNCHLCCGGDGHECYELTTSSSEDSCRDSFGSNEGLLTSEDKKFDPEEGGSRTVYVREMAKSLQVRLQSASDEKQKGKTVGNSNAYREKLAVSVISGSPESVCSSREDSLGRMHHCEGGRGATNLDASEDSELESVATKTKGNTETSHNEKDVLHCENPSTQIEKDATSHFYITKQSVLDRASLSNADVYSCTYDQSCSRTSLSGQFLNCRRMATEREEDNDSRLCATEADSLANESDTHKPGYEYPVVALKSSKLHRIFSKSSGCADSVEECHTDYHATSRSGKTSEKVHLTSGNLDVKMPSIIVNGASEEEGSRLEDQDKSEEDCCLAILPEDGSSSARVPPLLGRFISLEKHTCRIAFVSSFIGRAKTALSRVRPRSLSPVALGTKIKSMFFRESRDHALSKTSTVVVGSGRTLRQRIDPRHENSLRQSLGSNQWVESKNGEVSRQKAGSKEREDSGVISKQLLPPGGVTTSANQAKVHHISVAKMQYKPPSKSTHFSGRDSMQPDDEDISQCVFSFSTDGTSQNKEIKLRGSQSNTEIASAKGYCVTSCAATQPECATSDNPSTSDADFSDDLRRATKYYLGGQHKNLTQRQSTSSPFKMIILPALESIAEAESPSEESTAEDDMAQLKGEQFHGRDSLMKGIVSKVTTLGCDDGPSTGSSTSIARSKQTRARKSALRMSSSFEACRSESGQLSLVNGVCMPTPMKSRSLVSTLEAAQAELRAINAMAIISQEVKIKRYPSFPNLTDINDEDYSTSCVKTSGSVAYTVSEDSLGIYPISVEKHGDIKHGNSSQPARFPESNTKPECCTISKSGYTIQHILQTEFPPSLVVYGKIKTDRYSCSQKLKSTGPGTKVDTSFSRAGNGLANCEDTVTPSKHLTSSMNVHNATPKNSVGSPTNGKNRSERCRDLLSWKAETGQDVIELVNKMPPSPPEDSINEMLNECEFANFDQKNIPTSSKSTDGTENCGNNLQRDITLFQDDILVDAGISVAKYLNHGEFHREGRQFIEEAEQLSLTNECNYFSCERKQLIDSHGSITNIPLRNRKEGGHVNDADIFYMFTGEKNWNRNILCEHKIGEDELKDTFATSVKLSQCDVTKDFYYFTSTDSTNTTNVPGTDATYQLPTNTTNLPCTDAICQIPKITTNISYTDATYQLQTNTTNVSSKDATYQLHTNTANVPSKDAKYQLHTNTTNVPSIDGTYQLLTNTTNVPSKDATYQLHTNTTNVPSADATYQLHTYTTNVPSKDATYQHPTNTIDQCSINTTNQLPAITTNQRSRDTTNHQLSTNITNQPSTNTINQQLSSNTTNQRSKIITDQLSTHTTYQQLSTHTTYQQLSTTTTNQCSTNTTDQLSTYSTNQQLSTNTTNQRFTNTTDQLSTHTTDQQLSTITTNQQLSTFSPNQEADTHTQHDIYTPSAGLDKYNVPNAATDDPTMILPLSVDLHTSITLREKGEGNALSCRSPLVCVQHASLGDRHNQPVIDASTFSREETASVQADHNGAASPVPGESTTSGPFRQINGGVNVSSSTDEDKKNNTGQATAILDTCNSCLSDVESEDDATVGLGLCGQTPITDTTASVIKTISRGKKLKISNNKYILHFTESKTEAVKSETAIGKTANAKKRKPGGLHSNTHIPKGCSLRKKDSSKYMRSVANGFSECSAKTIDIDMARFKTKCRGNQFVVTSVSSIFGAPDKESTTGGKSVTDLTSRDVANSTVLNVESEATDDEDSDTLTNSGASQTLDSSITKVNSFSLKNYYNASENQLPIVDSQTEKGQMIDIVPVAKNGVNINSSPKSSLHSVQSYESMYLNNMDKTLWQDNALEVVPQMRLHHPDQRSLYFPEHALNKATYCCKSAGHTTAASFPAQTFHTGTMSKKMPHRISWSSWAAPTKEDFTSRTQYHLQRCDELLERSTGTLRRSQATSCRVQRQMDFCADKLKQMNYAAGRRPE